jgi:hypothetical protein
MTTAGYMGERSPDRVDAMVWALTELNQGKTIEIIEIFLVHSAILPEFID